MSKTFSIAPFNLIWNTHNSITYIVTVNVIYYVFTTFKLSDHNNYVDNY